MGILDRGEKGEQEEANEAKVAEQPTPPVEDQGDAPAGDVGNNPGAFDEERLEKLDHDDNANVAEQRAPVGHGEAGPLEGRVDGQSRRHVGEALTGHFVTVDRTVEGVPVESLPEGRDGYGVYEATVETDGEGYPETVTVRLRDETNALITVPYEALRPAQAGAR